MHHVAELEATGISRRRLAAGAAWSLPVIGATASTNVAGLAAGRSATIRFTVSAEVPPGEIVQWVYLALVESYTSRATTSRATLTVSGTPSECPVNEGCVSGGNSLSSATQGTTCPART